MGHHPKELSPKHRAAIRCIVLGMPVTSAAELVGLSLPRVSRIYRSPLGQAYALSLEAQADDYVARMLALGMTPRHISAAAGGGRLPRQCRPALLQRNQPSKQGRGKACEGGASPTDAGQPTQGDANQRDGDGWGEGGAGEGEASAGG